MRRQDGSEVEVEEASDEEQRRTVRLMRMRWRRELEASPWQRAVFLAEHRTSSSADDEVLSEADLAFLDFIADQVVRGLREKLRK